jgi:hypothetical protein
LRLFASSLPLLGALLLLLPLLLLLLPLLLLLLWLLLLLLLLLLPGALSELLLSVHASSSRLQVVICILIPALLHAQLLPQPGHESSI